MFTNFIGTQHVIQAKDMTAGEIIDFTFEEPLSIPTRLQQIIRIYIHIINSGELDYDGLLL
ncbi:hypothetical protein BAMA111019_14295 [Bacillus manliponensis]